LNERKGFSRKRTGNDRLEVDLERDAPLDKRGAEDASIFVDAVDAIIRRKRLNIWWVCIFRMIACKSLLGLAPVLNYGDKTTQRRGPTLTYIALEM
jgi:hypothetical protein